MSSNEDHSVGYCKPPKAHQFKKGQSGNPAGRKKGSRSLHEAAFAALMKRISVTEKGRKYTITKWDAACIQVANQAAAGVLKATLAAVDIVHHTEAHEAARTTGDTMGADDRRALDKSILAALSESLRQEQKEGS